MQPKRSATHTARDFYLPWCLYYTVCMGRPTYALTRTFFTHVTHSYYILFAFTLRVPTFTVHILLLLINYCFNFQTFLAPPIATVLWPQENFNLLLANYMYSKMCVQRLCPHWPWIYVAGNMSTVAHLSNDTSTSRSNEGTLNCIFTKLTMC